MTEGNLQWETAPYERERAVQYALKWAFARNPLFYEFDGIGGDCTNFVSQSILAGSCVMNFTPDYGWYFIDASDRAPAWTGVEFFYRFMTENQGIGPYGREVDREEVQVGDVVQLFNGTRYYHTLLITDLRPGEIFVSAHSYDAKNRDLASYSYVRERFIHIEGVRRDPRLTPIECFSILYDQPEKKPR
ncbi:MAG: amidase domain-containing protein [Clostridia bacterium]|nr:amidase domain-containing protein [Clostridia bacterium]